MDVCCEGLFVQKILKFHRLHWNHEQIRRWPSQTSDSQAVGAQDSETVTKNKEESDIWKHVLTLWLQRVIAERMTSVRTNTGTLNLAELGTAAGVVFFFCI